MRVLRITFSKGGWSLRGAFYPEDSPSGVCFIPLGCVLSGGTVPPFNLSLSYSHRRLFYLIPWFQNYMWLKSTQANSPFSWYNSVCWLPLDCYAENYFEDKFGFGENISALLWFGIQVEYILGELAPQSPSLLGLGYTTLSAPVKYAADPQLNNHTNFPQIKVVRQ